MSLDDEGERSVVQARALEQLDRGQEMDQLIVLLQNETMRDFVWRILVRANLYGSVHDPNNARMNVMEGRRQLGLEIMTEIATASPEAWVEMQLKYHRALKSEAIAQIQKAANRARST